MSLKFSNLSMRPPWELYAKADLREISFRCLYSRRRFWHRLKYCWHWTIYQWFVCRVLELSPRNGLSTSGIFCLYQSKSGKSRSISKLELFFFFFDSFLSPPPHALQFPPPPRPPLQFLSVRKFFLHAAHFVLLRCLCLRPKDTDIRAIRSRFSSSVLQIL